jgi:uncharacterized membrane protein YhaH (DUF805 family)
MIYKGRTNRAVYWFTVAILAGLAGVFSVVRLNPTISEIVFILLAAPRLHDIGRSAWWVMVGVGLEVAGLVLGLATGQLLLGPGLATLSIFGLMIWLGSVPGEAVANRFGEAPKPGLSFASKRAV